LNFKQNFSFACNYNFFKFFYKEHHNLLGRFEEEAQLLVTLDKCNAKDLLKDFRLLEVDECDQKRLIFIEQLHLNVHILVPALEMRGDLFL
jgi:hypothetical protein